MGCTVAVLAACSSGGRRAADSDAESAAVEIGPGAPEEAPASALLDAHPAQEPAWLARVPAPVAASATPAQQAAALDVTTSAALRAPPRFGRSTTTTTTEPDDAGTLAFAHGTYRGTMTMDLAYFNYCVTRDGNLAYAGRRTYRSEVEVFVNDPAEDDGVTERSPFNLIVGSETGVEGELVVISATVTADNRTGKSALFDYWKIREHGGEIDGTLTDRWPGVALNTITTERPLVPCRPGFTMALPDQLMEGATIAGAPPTTTRSSSRSSARASTGRSASERGSRSSERAIRADPLPVECSDALLDRHPTAMCRGGRGHRSASR